MLGGLGISKHDSLTVQQQSEILFLVDAWLESLNSADREKSIPCRLIQRPEGRRGMTISEKIFAMHDLNHKGFVAPGDIIRVHVDWILASEVSWAVGLLLEASELWADVESQGNGNNIQ